MTWFKDLDTPEVFGFLHLHGAAGTVGSGYRIPNYRALSAGDPHRIHVLIFDYRGFGRSSGSPTEKGVVLDAISVVEWAIDIAKIPLARIVLFGQSLGTAVNLAVAEHFALQATPTTFGGHVLVAPFVDAPTLMATYQIAGTIPLLGPIAKFPSIFGYLKRYLQHQWSSKDRIAAFVHASEATNTPYRITIIHAEDDYDVPSWHSQTLFWHGVNATETAGVSQEILDQQRYVSHSDLGPAGIVMQWQTKDGNTV